MGLAHAHRFSSGFQGPFFKLDPRPNPKLPQFSPLAFCPVSPRSGPTNAPFSPLPDTEEAMGFFLPKLFDRTFFFLASSGPPKDGPLLSSPEILIQSFFFFLCDTSAIIIRSSGDGSTTVFSPPATRLSWFKGCPLAESRENHPAFDLPPSGDFFPHLSLLSL